jgi:hypothetical protein
MRKDQRELMDEVVDRAADATEMILREGVAKAMNRFNRRLGHPNDAAESPSP